MSLEERLAKILLDEDYKTLFRSHQWINNHGDAVYTTIVERIHTSTCEEKTYRQDVLMIPCINERLMKLDMLKRLCDDMLDDKFGGLEIKETHIDEN